MSHSAPPIPEGLDIAPAGLEARCAHLLSEIAEQPAASRDARRGRRMIALGVAGGLGVAAVAGAATGVLPVGSELPTPTVAGDAEPLYTSARVVVATGSAPESGRWEMTFAQTDAGPCVGLRLVDRIPPGASRPDLHEGCGDPASFTAGRVGGGTSVGRPEYLVHGRAPERAETVRLTAAGGIVLTAETHEGPSDVPGDFYLLATPPGLKNGTVSWLDGERRPHGPGLTVPGTVDYGERPDAPDRPR